MTFQELNLSEPLLKALAAEGYTHPTPIQQRAIPQVLAGRDVLGCAQTGTGKTAAFALPILDRLMRTGDAHAHAAEHAAAPALQHSQDPGRHPQHQQRQRHHRPPAIHQQRHRRPPHRVIRALVLAPTRELAAQIGDGFRAYGRHAPIKHTVIFGGVGQNPQTQALNQGVDVLVATPGRLLDLMNQGYVDLSRVEVFVLDEADRMLDMGFIHDIRKVAAKLPAAGQRQTLLFSATMPEEIRDLANSLLRNPVRVEVAPVSSTAERIEQFVCFVDDRRLKTQLLVHLLGKTSFTRVLVFTRTKHGADKVARVVNRAGIGADAIHSNKSQNARLRALESFRAGKTPVLVASDIAARGIDIDEISHVFNYDLPNIAETYVHRIGRTARAGASGVAISFCDHEEKTYLKDIEKLTGIKPTVLDDHPKYKLSTEEPAPAGAASAGRQQPRPRHRQPRGPVSAHQEIRRRRRRR